MALLVLISAAAVWRFLTPSCHRCVDHRTAACSSELPDAAIPHTQLQMSTATVVKLSTHSSPKVHLGYLGSDPVMYGFAVYSAKAASRRQAALLNVQPSSASGSNSNLAAPGWDDASWDEEDGWEEVTQAPASSRGVAIAQDHSTKGRGGASAKPLTKAKPRPLDDW